MPPASVTSESTAPRGGSKCAPPPRVLWSVFAVPVPSTQEEDVSPWSLASVLGVTSHAVSYLSPLQKPN